MASSRSINELLDNLRETISPEQRVQLDVVVQAVRQQGEATGAATSSDARFRDWKREAVTYVMGAARGTCGRLTTSQRRWCQRVLAKLREGPGEFFAKLFTGMGKTTLQALLVVLANMVPSADTLVDGLTWRFDHPSGSCKILLLCTGAAARDNLVLNLTCGGKRAADLPLSKFAGVPERLTTELSAHVCEYEAGMWQPGHKSYIAFCQAWVVVATYAKVLDCDDMKSLFATIVIDEADYGYGSTKHQAAGASEAGEGGTESREVARRWWNIRRECARGRPAFLFSATTTSRRDSKMPAPYFNANYKNALEEGSAKRMRVQHVFPKVLNVTMDENGLMLNKIDLSKNVRQLLANNPQLLRFIIRDFLQQVVAKRARDGIPWQTLVPVQPASIATGRKLVEVIYNLVCEVITEEEITCPVTGQPLTCNWVHTDMADAMKQARIRAFSAYQTDIMLTVNMFDRAYDNPMLGILVNLRPASQTAHATLLQLLGRILRALRRNRQLETHPSWPLFRERFARLDPDAADHEPQEALVYEVATFNNIDHYTDFEFENFGENRKDAAAAGWIAPERRVLEGPWFAANPDDTSVRRGRSEKKGRWHVVYRRRQSRTCFEEGGTDVTVAWSAWCRAFSSVSDGGGAVASVCRVQLLGVPPESDGSAAGSGSDDERTPSPEVVVPARGEESDLEDTSSWMAVHTAVGVALRGQPPSRGYLPSELYRLVVANEDAFSYMSPNGSTMSERTFTRALRYMVSAESTVPHQIVRKGSNYFYKRRVVVDIDERSSPEPPGDARGTAVAGTGRGSEPGQEQGDGTRQEQEQRTIRQTQGQRQRRPNSGGPDDADGGRNEAGGRERETDRDGVSDSDSEYGADVRGAEEEASDSGAGTDASEEGSADEESDGESGDDEGDDEAGSDSGAGNGESGAGAAGDDDEEDYVPGEGAGVVPYSDVNFAASQADIAHRGGRMALPKFDVTYGDDGGAMDAAVVRERMQAARAAAEGTVGDDLAPSPASAAQPRIKCSHCPEEFDVEFECTYHHKAIHKGRPKADCSVARKFTGVHCVISEEDISANISVYEGLHTALSAEAERGATVRREDPTGEVFENVPEMFLTMFLANYKDGGDQKDALLHHVHAMGLKGALPAITIVFRYGHTPTRNRAKRTVSRAWVEQQHREDGRAVVHVQLKPETKISSAGYASLVKETRNEWQCDLPPCADVVGSGMFQRADRTKRVAGAPMLLALYRVERTQGKRRGTAGVVPHDDLVCFLAAVPSAKAPSALARVAGAAAAAAVPVPASAEGMAAIATATAAATAAATVTVTATAAAGSDATPLRGPRRATFVTPEAPAARRALEPAVGPAPTWQSAASIEVPAHWRAPALEFGGAEQQGASGPSNDDSDGSGVSSGRRGAHKRRATDDADAPAAKRARHD